MSLDPHVSMNTMPKEFRRLFLEAEGAFSSGDYETARNLYQNLADKYADYIDGWFGLAKTHLILEDYVKFASCYAITKDVAPDFDPFPSISNIIRKNPHLGIKMIAGLADQEMYEEALRYVSFTTMLLKGKEPDPTLLNLKKIITERLDKKKAEKNSAEEKKKKGEKNKWIATLVITIIIIVGGLIYFYLFFKDSSAKSHYIEGMNHFHTAKIMFRNYTKYGADLAEFHTNLEMAKGEFEQALEIEPHYALPHYMLGEIYLIQSEIEFLKIRRNLGFSQEIFNKLLRDSKSELLKAIEIEPNLPDAHLTLAKIYYDQVKKKQAMEYCQQAINKAEKYYAEDREKKEDILRRAERLKKLIEKLR